MLEGLKRFYHNLNDEAFIRSLDDTRERFQLYGYFFLGFFGLFYIAVDRGLMPEKWTQWQFLGTRIAVAVATWIILMRPAWRRSNWGLYIPGTLLFLGMSAMTNEFPGDRTIEVYQGISMVFAAYTLITFVKLKHYLAYVVLVYSFYFSIWWVNPPISFDAWMSKGGFANFSTMVLVAAVFYVFRLHLAFQNYSLVREIQAKNEEIVGQRFRLETILSCLPQAVFLIDLSFDRRSLIISQGLSLELGRLLGRSFKGGENPITAIFQATDLNRDQLSQIESVLMSSLKEEILPWELNRHALPRTLRLKRGGEDLHIELDWACLQELDGTVGQILVSLKDATEIDALHASMYQQSIDSRRITEVIAVEREKLLEFFQLAQNLMDENRDALSQDGFAKTHIHVIYRNIHTLKGLARTYNINDLTQVIHDAEGIIELEQKQQSFDKARLRSLFAPIDQVILEYKHLIKRIYQSHEKHQEITVDQVHFEHLVSQIIPAHIEQRTDSIQDNVLAMRLLYCFNLERILTDEVQMSKQLALKLNKPEPKIIFKGDIYQLSEGLRTPFRKAFVHLFRNSIDHGIEDAELRMRLGKPPEGTMILEVRRLDHQFQILVSDDGNGLNLKKIHDRAKLQGLADPSRPYSDEEIGAFIFAVGLSTSEATGEISGRGVGMDAVRTFLQHHGCGIAIELLGPSRHEHCSMFRFAISLDLRYMQPIIPVTELAMLHQQPHVA